MMFRLMMAAAAAASCALMAVAGSAQAGERCRYSSDNPMVTNQGFGIASCRPRVHRYHLHDYDGESAYGYAQSPDPMVWSQSQWRSSLMGGYATAYDDRYDRRQHRSGAVSRRIVIREVWVEDERVAPPPASANKGAGIATRRGSKWVYKRSNGENGFAAHRCPGGGMTILTWEKGRAISTCTERGNLRQRMLLPSTGDNGWRG